MLLIICGSSLSFLFFFIFPHFNSYIFLSSLIFQNFLEIDSEYVKLIMFHNLYYVK